MSLLGWIAFAICSLAVAFYYHTSRDDRFLLFALPSLAMLIIIPFLLSWMSRRSFLQASREYERVSRLYKVRNISNDMIGTAVKIIGNVNKISFKWLNRPHFQVSDETEAIRVIMFTAPVVQVNVGDKVEVLGVVMKNIFRKNTPVISAVSIKKK
ncbi:MAG TPA: hypothetical protein PK874_05815 [Desulfobacteraceae bacterium]|nr:hypothetical protein [Desulfobacteraceae bacterium]HPJ68173.1 hypothetical protein [Desulfobacteraceae bacterium]